MYRPALALVVLLMVPATFGAEHAPTTDDLVNQLGDDSYEIRERAAAQLTALGLTAKDALEKGKRHIDVEVQARCRRILTRVEALALEQTLSAFLKDGNGKLPGWERYRKAFGEDRSAREMFVEMQRAEPGLLDALEHSPKTAQEMVVLLCREYQQFMIMGFNDQRQQISLGTVAALVFVGSQPEMKLDIQSSSMIYNFVNQQAFMSALQGGPRQGRARKLLGLFASRPADPNMAYQSMVLAMRFDLKEGLEPALGMVRDNGANASQRAYAVVAVGKLGGKEHVPDFEKLLDNQTTCATYQVNNKQITTQMRDVALAVCVHLTGQSLEQYGFARVQRNEQMLFYPYSLGFEDNSEREKAFAKWKEWAAARASKSAG